MNWRSTAETFLITLAALLCSLAIFGLFMLVFAKTHPSPLDLYHAIYLGAFGAKVVVGKHALTRGPRD